VSVNADTATVAPVWIATLLRFRFAPDVPTLKSTLRTLAEVSRLPQVAVPVPSAEVSLVMALAVAVPLELSPKASAESARSARRFWAPIAVSASVGWVPS
jgi:hypothetical protein